MRIVLAPMEGVVDHLMREMLTEIGGFDLCITEFVRVVDQLLPRRVFTRLCPELLQDGKTRAGTPVRVQLLGQEPNWLAENAARAVELGSPGIDLNLAAQQKPSIKVKAVPCCCEKQSSCTASSVPFGPQSPPITP